MIRHGAGARVIGEDVVGLLVMILGLALFFAAHVFTTQRDARAQAIAKLGEGTYKIALFPGLAGGSRADHLGLCALPRDRLDRRLVSAESDAAHHGRPDAAGRDPGGGARICAAASMRR